MNKKLSLERIVLPYSINPVPFGLTSIPAIGEIRRTSAELLGPEARNFYRRMHSHIYEVLKEDGTTEYRVRMIWKNNPKSQDEYLMSDALVHTGGGAPTTSDQRRAQAQEFGRVIAALTEKAYQQYRVVTVSSEKVHLEPREGAFNSLMVSMKAMESKNSHQVLISPPVTGNMRLSLPKVAYDPEDDLREAGVSEEVIAYAKKSFVSGASIEGVEEAFKGLLPTWGPNKVEKTDSVMGLRLLINAYGMHLTPARQLPDFTNDGYWFGMRYHKDKSGGLATHGLKGADTSQATHAYSSASILREVTRESEEVYNAWNELPVEARDDLHDTMDEVMKKLGVFVAVPTQKMQVFADGVDPTKTRFIIPQHMITIWAEKAVTDNTINLGPHRIGFNWNGNGAEKMFAAFNKGNIPKQGEIPGTCFCADIKSMDKKYRPDRMAVMIGMQFYHLEKVPEVDRHFNWHFAHTLVSWTMHHNCYHYYKWVNSLVRLIEGLMGSGTLHTGDKNTKLVVWKFYTFLAKKTRQTNDMKWVRAIKDGNVVIWVQGDNVLGKSFVDWFSWPEVIRYFDKVLDMNFKKESIVLSTTMLVSVDEGGYIVEPEPKRIVFLKRSLTKIRFQKADRIVSVKCQREFDAKLIVSATTIEDRQMYMVRQMAALAETGGGSFVQVKKAYKIVSFLAKKLADERIVMTAQAFLVDKYVLQKAEKIGMTPEEIVTAVENPNRLIWRTLGEDDKYTERDNMFDEQDVLKREKLFSGKLDNLVY